MTSFSSKLSQKNRAYVTLSVCSISKGYKNFTKINNLSASLSNSKKSVFAPEVSAFPESFAL